MSERHLSEYTEPTYSHDHLLPNAPIQQVEDEIAGLWWPDVENILGLVSASIKQVGVIGEQRTVIAIASPGHGYGKTRILHPLLEYVFREEYPQIPYMWGVGGIQSQTPDRPDRFSTEFKIARGIVLFDEGNFYPRLDFDRDAEGIKKYTAAFIWNSQTKLNKSEREVALQEDSSRFQQHGFEVVRYNVEMSGIPAALALRFVDCFQIASDYRALCKEIILGSGTVKPRFLTHMMDKRKMEDFKTDFSLRLMGGIVDVTTRDLPFVARLLGVSILPEDLEKEVD